MNELFLIPLIYQGNEHEYKARFERWGYTHRIAVLIGEMTVVFEPDEEGAYRALNAGHPGAIPEDLLQALSRKLTALID
jgi:hypothetical protein